MSGSSGCTGPTGPTGTLILDEGCALSGARSEFTSRLQSGSPVLALARRLIDLPFWMLPGSGATPAERARRDWLCVAFAGSSPCILVVTAATVFANLEPLVRAVAPDGCQLQELYDFFPWQAIGEHAWCATGGDFHPVVDRTGVYASVLDMCRDSLTDVPAQVILQFLGAPPRPSCPLTTAFLAPPRVTAPRAQQRTPWIVCSVCCCLLLAVLLR